MCQQFGEVVYNMIRYDTIQEFCVCSKASIVYLMVQQHPFNGPLSGTTRVSQYQKSNTNLDLLEQETVSGSGISWAICKSAHCSRQITMSVPHHSVVYRPDALPATEPTASMH